VKKGRHRRFEEARALKRSQDIDFDDLLESLSTEGPPRPATDADVGPDEDPADVDDD
jgi:hypothetical protein